MIGDNVRYMKVSEKTEKYLFTVIMAYSMTILTILFMINFIIQNYFDKKYCFVLYAFILLIIVLTMILIVILPKIIQRNFGYSMDNNKLEVKTGIVFFNKKMVMYKNVYKLEIKKKLIGRIFGISSFSLITSAGSVKIYFLDDKQLDNLYSKVLERIEEDTV